jgi:uncharacterized membrane protein (UPF0127 family)
VARSHFLLPLLRKDSGSLHLVNRTRGVVLATKIVPAFDSHSRRTGLLRHAELPHDTVLAIAPSNAIHTFGMHFAIDVLFVRRDGTVVKRVLNLQKRRLAAAWRGFAVLEFGAGHPGVAQTQVGDALAVAAET